MAAPEAAIGSQATGGTPAIGDDNARGGGLYQSLLERRNQLRDDRAHVYNVAMGMLAVGTFLASLGSLSVKNPIIQSKLEYILAAAGILIVTGLLIAYFVRRERRLMAHEEAGTDAAAEPATPPVAPDATAPVATAPVATAPVATPPSATPQSATDPLELADVV